MNPKTFISYSWSSPEHQQWVLDLATQLRENGVDVALDKWDLREGHDAIAFMEKMVTDPNIGKVIVVLDRVYAEKSDSKKGGVGTESQIISPEIYAKTDQEKFVGVIAEVDSEGKPYLPAFYRSRIYIDLSHSDIYATNFDQLLRWVFNKPAFPKPALGKPPEFLNESEVLLPTRSRARRAIDLFRNGAAGASGAADEYFSALAESFENLRISQESGKAFDDLVLQSIGAFLPYRDEYIEVVSSIARYASSRENVRLVHKFLESLIPYMYRPKNVNQWSTDDFDNFKFIVHELFLYTSAIFLKHDRFDAVADLLGEYYVGSVPDFQNAPMESYGVFRTFMESLKFRNQRLALNRISIRADLLKERSEASGVSLRELMQADFIMFLRDAVVALSTDTRQGWWPETLIWLQDSGGPFEIFARAESAQYFASIRPMLSVEKPSDLMELLPNFGGANSKLRSPSWEYYSIPIERAANLEKLATRP